MKKFVALVLVYAMLLSSCTKPSGKAAKKMIDRKDTVGTSVDKENVKVTFSLSTKDDKEKDGIGHVKKPPINVKAGMSIKDALAKVEGCVVGEKNNPICDIEGVKYEYVDFKVSKHGDDNITIGTDINQSSETLLNCREVKGKNGSVHCGKYSVTAHTSEDKAKYEEKEAKAGKWKEEEKKEGKGGEEEEEEEEEERCNKLERKFYDKFLYYDAEVDNLERKLLKGKEFRKLFEEYTKDTLDQGRYSDISKLLKDDTNYLALQEDIIPFEKGIDQTLDNMPESLKGSFFEERKQLEKNRKDRDDIYHKVENDPKYKKFKCKFKECGIGPRIKFSREFETYKDGVDAAERNLLKDEEFQKLFKEYTKDTLNQGRYSDISKLLEDNTDYLALSRDVIPFEKGIEQALDNMPELLKSSLSEYGEQFKKNREGRDNVNNKVENDPEYIKLECEFSFMRLRQEGKGKGKEKKHCASISKIFEQLVKNDEKYDLNKLEQSKSEVIKKLKKDETFDKEMKLLKPGSETSNESKSEDETETVKDVLDSLNKKGHLKENEDPKQNQLPLYAKEFKSLIEKIDFSKNFTLFEEYDKCKSMQQKGGEKKEVKECKMLRATFNGKFKEEKKGSKTKIDDAERNLLKNDEFRKLFEGYTKDTLDQGRYNDISILKLLEDNTTNYLALQEDIIPFEKGIEQALKKMGTESLKNRSLFDDGEKFKKAIKDRDNVNHEVENDPEYKKLKCKFKFL